MNIPAVHKAVLRRDLIAGIEKWEARIQGMMHHDTRERMAAKQIKPRRELLEMLDENQD